MDNQLKNLGSEIDVAIEESDVPALNALIVKCNKALESTDFQNRAIIHFFKANCYSALAGMQSGEPDYMWSWQQNDKVLEILSLETQGQVLQSNIRFKRFASPPSHSRCANPL